MDIDDKTVKKVAQIARLHISEAEVKKFTPQLKEILAFFEQLKHAPADEEPSFLPIPIRNVTRDDNPKHSLSQDDALKNAPHKQDGYIKGPKAV